MRMIPKKISVSTRARGREHEVRAEHAGDRSARTDVRDACILRIPEPEGRCRLRSHRRNAGSEVPEQESHAAQGIFDVVPEDPEEQHVEPDVRPVRVHEHPREDPLVPGERMHDERHRDVAWPAERARVVAVANDVNVDARFRQLPEPDECVGDDQPGDDRKRLVGTLSREGTPFTRQ
jgi:hypothetical protein